MLRTSSANPAASAPAASASSNASSTSWVLPSRSPTVGLTWQAATRMRGTATRYVGAHHSRFFSDFRTAWVRKSAKNGGGRERRETGPVRREFDEAIDRSADPAAVRRAVAVLCDERPALRDRMEED